MPEKDDLDLLLDSALRTYADPGPEPGLNQRVLARLAETRLVEKASATSAPRRRWLPWAIALPLAAALALLFLWLPKTTPPPPNHAQLAPNSKRSTIAAVPAKPPTAMPAAASRRSVNRLHPHAHSAPQIAGTQTLPKQDIFPTPQPLTPEEQALIDLAGRTPAKELQALIDAQNQLDKPLSIAAIRIPPIELPDQGKN